MIPNTSSLTLVPPSPLTTVPSPLRRGSFTGRLKDESYKQDTDLSYSMICFVYFMDHAWIVYNPCLFRGSVGGGVTRVRPC